MNNSRGGRRSCRSLYLGIAVVLFFLLFVYTPLPQNYDDQRDALVNHVTSAATGHKASANASLPSLATTKSKYAYATFLAGDAHQQELADINDDNYFVAARILTYQILHAPETRSPAGIPFIVLVTKAVSEPKRHRLRLDGAIVIEAETIAKPAWVEVETSTWQDVFDKLRLWELTQFDLITFLDGDTVLARPLDGVFNDTAVATRKTSPDIPRPHPGLLPPMPHTYAFASRPEMNTIHTYPPSEETHSYPNIAYLNAGFFVLRPSLDLLAYYLALLQLPDSFVPTLPEQNLLNEVHNWAGAMPWQTLGTEWNIHYPTKEDLDGGVASLHEKWWAPGDSEGLGRYLRGWRWRMEGFYQGREGGGKGHQ
nr:hypothetical protein B0A51_16339 [Rachicladosporium sp. CCFEE 5018]